MSAGLFTRLACPACGAGLQPHRLVQRGSAELEIDLCPGCRLVWFDPLEFASIDTSGWIALLRELGRPGPRRAPLQPLEHGPCPRCRSALKPVSGALSRGRYMALSCPRGHGQAQSEGALLASRGLFRPLLLADRVALATEKATLDCLNCGAPMAGDAEHCAHCHSPAVVLDIDRLCEAIGLVDANAAAHRPATESQDASPRLQPWACHACGKPLDPTRHAHCPACRHPLVAPSLAALGPLLDAAEARLGEAATLEHRPRRAPVPAFTVAREVPTATEMPLEDLPAERFRVVFGLLVSLAVIFLAIGLSGS